jgi:hypothetical protein
MKIEPVNRQINGHRVVHADRNLSADGADLHIFFRSGNIQVLDLPENRFADLVFAAACHTRIPRGFLYLVRQLIFGDVRRYNFHGKVNEKSQDYRHEDGFELAFPSFARGSPKQLYFPAQDACLHNLRLALGKMRVENAGVQVFRRCYYLSIRREPFD